MLARIHDVLVPGGLLFMREPHAADTLAGNLANPMAPPPGYGPRQGPVPLEYVIGQRPAA